MREPAGNECCRERVEVRVARLTRVDPLESLRGPQEQDRRITSTVRSERHAARRSTSSCARCDSSKGPRSAIAASASASSSAPAWRFASAATSARLARGARFDRQLCGPLQERGGRGETAARLRPPGGTFQLCRDIVVGM